MCMVVHKRCSIYNIADIDECGEGSDNCTGMSQCINSESGGFSCSCDHLSGFTIDTDTYSSCEGIYIHAAL